MSDEFDNEKMISEWPYFLEVEELSGKPLCLSISPDEEQNKALIKRLDVLGLEDVCAELKITRKKQIVYVSGHLKAKVFQPCVVSLEPVAVQVEDEFESWFADPQQAVSIAKARREREMKKGAGEQPILDEHDDPEVIIDGQIDLGELAVQYLSLSITPYPHGEGVHYKLGDDSEEAYASETRKNPFAALKDWKDKAK